MTRSQKKKIITTEIINYRDSVCFGYTKEKLAQLISKIDNTLICCGTYNYSSENFNVLKKIREDAYERYYQLGGVVRYEGLNLILA